MRSRRARRGEHAVRQHAAQLLRENSATLDAAYEQLRREELAEVNAAGDQNLSDAVDALTAAERSRLAGDAWRAETINDLRRTAELNVQVTTSNGMRPWSQAATARRVATSEVAAALHIPERTADTLIEESRALVETFTATLEALRRGDLSYRHAKSIIDHAMSLREELRLDFEQRVLPLSATLTPSRFELTARATRERMDATTITQRHLAAVEKRETSWEPARDGMGWFHWFDTAANTLAAYNRTTDVAMALQGRDQSRTLAQLRADVTKDLLIDGEVAVDADGPVGRDVREHGGLGSRRATGIRPTVVLTIPALSLLGVKSASGEIEPAILSGYGPIDIDTARRLAGSAKSWIRVLTHPITGVTLSVEGRQRKIPAGLRAWLGLRDRVCRKVGCNKAVAHCEVDHTQEWQHGGRHAHDNLGHLCPAHHAEKHHTPIHMSHLPNEDIEWTLASGKTYISEPDMRMDGHGAA